MKIIEKEAIRLTSEILRRFWQKDPNYHMDYFAEDIMWIGAQKDEFIVGIEATKADLANALEEIPSCVLLQAEFHAISTGSRCCVVIGNYLTTTDKSADFFLQNRQRCTFVWENTRDGMKIHHIHISNPVGELRLAEGELFPNTMGKMAQAYMEHQLKQLSECHRVIVAGDNGSVHSLMHSEIMYVAAFSKDSIIATVNGEILAKTGISAIHKMLGDQFIQVHRGYVINPNYVSSIERYVITMLDGEEIPVPQKRFNDIRDRIRNFYKPSED